MTLLDINNWVFSSCNEAACLPVKNIYTYQSTGTSQNDSVQFHLSFLNIINQMLEWCSFVNVLTLFLFFLVPSSNLYIQLNALQFTMDERSILWLNQFVLDLKQSLNQFMTMYKLNDNSKSEEHVDVRVDGLMIKVQFGKMQHRNH